MRAVKRCGGIGRRRRVRVGGIRNRRLYSSTTPTTPGHEGKQVDRRAERVKPYGPTVWSEFTPLAVKHKAVNLGQGFPDFPAPQMILSAAKEAIDNGFNQYTLVHGHPRLVNAISKHYSPLFSRNIDPVQNVLTTVGCTEGIYLACSALLNPGDEVIIFEPFYDIYPADVELAGAKPVYVPLRFPKTRHSSSSEWTIDPVELESKITSKTKLMIVNNPSNIPGKIFSSSELETLARIAIKHDLLVLSDEVYEAMVYDNKKHIRIATLPGMWDRTLTFGSAGKTFSVTGHKVGWVIGPKHLKDPLALLHAFTCFCFSTPLQEATAVAFEQAEEKNYWQELKDMYLGKREKLVKILDKCKLDPIIPEGSYFVLADTRRIEDDRIKGEFVGEGERDYRFCRWLTTEVGVAAIPPSAFYCKEDRGLVNHLARFTFCKKDEVLEEAGRRLLQKL